MELKKEDWEKVKNEAEIGIKQALINLELHKNILKTAENKLKDFK